jgi:hypothetical protein
MSANIYLIGTCHTDIDTAMRHYRAYQQFSPDTIILEQSDDFIDQETLRVNSLVRDLKLPVPEDRIQDLLQFTCGSFMAAKVYQDESKKPIIIINADQKVMEVNLARNQGDYDSAYFEEDWDYFFTKPGIMEYIMQKAIGGDIFRGLYQEGTPQHFAEQIAISRMLAFDTPKRIIAAQDVLDTAYFVPSNLDTEEIPELMERDEQMANAVEGNSRVVVSCGFEHAYGEYFNLYDRLLDAGHIVRRMSLIDFHHRNRRITEAQKKATEKSLASIVEEHHKICS